MEITELNLISDFEAGVNCLQNPSLVSHIFPTRSLTRSPQIYKWGAFMIIAILAAFTGLIVRIKLLFLKITRIKLFPSSTIDSIKLLNFDDFDCEDSDFDDDDGDTCSQVSSNHEDEESEERESSSEEDFFVSSGIGRRFSWSDFAAGSSVVRLWDNLTAGFDCEEEDPTDDVVRVWAEKTNDGGVFLGLYDSRVGVGAPEMTAEWSSLRRRAVSGAGFGGAERLYVRDDVTGELTVADLRNVKSPLVGVWDANAVIGVDYR